MQALIAFGPDLKDLDGVLAQARTRGLTTRSSARASGLEGLSGALAPCMLLFSHLVPGKGRKPITDADVKSWESRFEPRLAPILNRAKFDKVSYQFVATKDTGNITLNLQFASIDDARLEEAFEKQRLGAATAPPDPATLERIARHESGHTLIAWLGGHPPLQVTIVGRGHAGGYMERETDKTRLLHTKSEIEQLIREAMGGRAAEIVYYGEQEGLSSGVAGDLGAASRQAMRMVREFGMSEDLGLVALENPGALADGPLAARVTEAAERIVRAQLDQAVRLLSANRASLDRLSFELREKNRLTREDLTRILEGSG